MLWFCVGLLRALQLSRLDARLGFRGEGAGHGLYQDHSRPAGPGMGLYSHTP